MCRIGMERFVELIRVIILQLFPRSLCIVVHRVQGVVRGMLGRTTAHARRRVRFVGHVLFWALVKTQATEGVPDSFIEITIAR
jgi:hypothetical protein